MTPFPWYETVGPDQELQQGDILRGFPVITPTESAEEGKTELGGLVHEYDFIILTQSCDIESGRIDMILGCPVVELSDLCRQSGKSKKSLGESIRKKHKFAFCLLTPCDLPEWGSDDYLVANFQIPLSVPLSHAKRFARESGRRLRVLPPYREHLSQSFAQFIMRVGLPEDIPKVSGCILGR